MSETDRGYLLMINDEKGRHLAPKSGDMLVKGDWLPRVGDDYTLEDLKVDEEWGRLEGEYVVARVEHRTGSGDFSDSQGRLENLLAGTIVHLRKK